MNDSATPIAFPDSVPVPDASATVSEEAAQKIQTDLRDMLNTAARTKGGVPDGQATSAGTPGAKPRG